MARGQSARWLLVMQGLAGTVLAGDRPVAAVSEPQPSHHQLRSRCPRPLEALWDTLPLKEDGDGL